MIIKNGKVIEAFAKDGGGISSIHKDGETVFEVKKEGHVLPEGLVLYFDAINNTGNGHNPNLSHGNFWKDLSGNNNDGHLDFFGAGCWDNDCLMFNGVSNFINTPLNQIGGQESLGNNFTISSKVLMAETNNYRGIAGGHSFTPGIIFGQWENGFCTFKVLGLTGTINVSPSDFPNGFNTLTMVVSSGNEFILYINGIIFASTPCPSFVAMNPAVPFGIGNAFSGGDRYFKGSMKNFMIFDRALSGNEVASII